MKNLDGLIKSLKKVNIDNFENKDISFLTDDSRKVSQGSLFVAIEGLKVDGHKFINEAIKKGAVAVVGEEEFKAPSSVSYIQVPDSREAFANLCSSWFDKPSKKMKVIGVTGTDGKTTTADLIYKILSLAGKKTGLISTVGAEINGKIYDTGLHVTNPEPYPLQEFLAKMVEEDCEYAVLEVTSHGIDQKRIYGIDFDIAVLTNITHEHLDYHKSFKNYRDTKVKFLLSAKTITVNKDDPAFEYIRGKVTNQKLISYSKENKADFIATDIKDNKGLGFRVSSGSFNERITSNLIGLYNVSNCLAAIAAGVEFGIKPEDIIKAIQSFELPLGRMQKMDFGQDFTVYVDFAHTPNALQEALLSLRNITKGKLISVFGCAGERDSQKRNVMGEISGKIADYSIFTAEDPRSEDIYEILNTMSQGAIKANTKEASFGLEEDTHPDNNNLFIRVPERHEAISLALQKIARKDDCVVILGKGHERSLAYKEFEHPWSDQEMVEDVLKGRNDLAVIVMAAGRGKRMNSDFPKVLSEIAGRPLISYTLENLRKARLKNIVLVVGFEKEKVIKETQGAVSYTYQEELLGTAHATEKGLTKVPDNIKTIIVLNGDDSAFYKPETINDVISTHLRSKSVLSFVSLISGSPEGLGRVVRDKNGQLETIIEEKVATEQEKKIKEVNDGLYVFDKNWLKENLKKIKKSPQGEYYLVDLVGIALKENLKVNCYRLKNNSEWQGVNTPEQLEEADRKMKERLSNGIK